MKRFGKHFSVFVLIFLPVTAMATPVTNGLVLWLDANDIDGAGNGPIGDPTNGVSVSNWVDKSIRAADALQAVTNSRPTVVTNAINGLTALRFDGDDRMVFGDLNARTVFAVTLVDAAAGNYDELVGRQCCDDGIRRTGNAGWNFPGDGNDFGNPAGSTYRVNGFDTAVAAEGVWHSLEAFRGNGTWIFDAVGGYFGGTRDLNGDVAELIIYDRILTPFEINAVGFYLQSKYGLAGDYLGPSFPWVVPQNATRANMADNLSATSADVVGNVVSTGASPTTVTLLYGPTDGGTNTSVWAFTNVFGPASVGLVTNRLTNLTAGTKYFFRYLATNSNASVILDDDPGIFITLTTGAPPAAVSNGLVVWFNASSLNLPHGAPVCAWPNLVPNVFSASQVNPTEQPVFSTNGLNGQPAVCFDNAAGGDLLFQDDFSALFSNAATLFVVAEINGAHNYNLFETRANDPRWRDGNFGRMGVFRTGRVNYQNGLMPVFGAHIFAIESSGSLYELSLNGVPQGNAGAQFNAGAGFLNAIGGRTQDNQQRLNGCIAEILIYDRALSAPEQQIVGTYLETKYGLNTAYKAPDEPAVENNPASDVTMISATLNGTLSATGTSATAVTVYWGPTDGGTNMTAWSNRVSLGFQNVGPVSNQIAGLNPNAVYYYRFFASNASHQVWADSSAYFLTDLNPLVFGSRLKIQLCGYTHSDTLTNFPLMVRLGTNIPKFSYSQFASPTGGDLRVVDGVTGTEMLDFEIEEWNTNGESIIWVRMPELKSSDDCIGLLWGNPIDTVLPPSSSDGSVWVAGYRGVWHMTEPNAEDSSFPHNNGNVGVAPVSNAAGVIGTAQSFSNSYIQIENPQNFNHQDEMTVSAWIQVDGTWNSGWQAFVSKRGEGNQGWQLRRYNTNTEQPTFTVRGTTGNDELIGTTDVNDAQWHHLVGTYNGIQRKLYVDGRLENAVADTGLITLTAQNDEVKIGASDGGVNRHLGLIDEVQIMDTAVSEAWVWAAYANAWSNANFQCYAQVDDALAPVIFNADVSGISTNAAVMNGNLIFEGITGGAVVRVYYGVNDGGAIPGDWDSFVTFFPAFNAPTFISTNVAGLLPDTDYYYRYQALDQVGFATNSWAATAVRFRTLGLPVVENTGGANPVGPGTAVLNGAFETLNRGDVTIYSGQMDGDTNPVAWSSALSLGSVSSETFSVTTSNALYGVAHYYRVFASNAVGNDWASSTTVFKVNRPLIPRRQGLRIRQFDTVSAAANLAPISLLQGMAEEGAGIQVSDINFNGAAIPNAFPYITDPNTLSLLWEGLFVPNAGAGTYSFGLRSDDRSVLYIDLNGDGDFDDAGELVIDRPCCGVTLGWVDLNDHPYRIAIGFQQGGGGLYIEAKWAAGFESQFANMSYINGYSGVFFAPSEDAVAVNNLPANGVTTNAAILNATINATQSVITVTAYWGPVDGGTNPAGWANAVSLGNFTNVYDFPLSLAVTGLVMGSNYFYTFGFTNCREDVMADPSSAFSTVAEAPQVDNGGGATNLSVLTATLQGDLIAGDAADVTVYWGTSDGGSNAASWQNATPIGQVLEGPFSADLSGFLYGVAYSYRMYASNALGDAWAPVASSFKTRSAADSGVPGLDVFTYDTTFGAPILDPITNLLSVIPTGMHTLNGPLSYQNFGMLQADYPTLTAGNTYSVLWRGVLRIAPGQEGVYTFGTASDDGSVVYIDLDDDGEFDFPGERVVNNNNDHGRVEATGIVTMSVARCYNFVTAFYENQGGEIMEVKFKRGAPFTYAQLDFLDTSISSNQNFFQTCPLDGGFSLALTGASGVTTNSAVLNAELMASGSVQCVSFHWGPTDGGTNAAAWSNSMSMGCFSNVPLTGISLPVAGLNPGTTYYYSFRATNCLDDIWVRPAATFNTPLVLGDFSYRTKMTFCGYDKGETLTNFPVLVALGSNISGFDYTQFASSVGGDLRFLSGDLSQELPYEVEVWNTNGLSWFWVQVPQLVDSNTCLNAYWGNPTAPFAPAYTTNGGTWAEEYIAVWHLSDSNATDSTSNRWDGTSNGNLDIPGVIQGAQAFNENEFIHAGPGIDISNKSFSVSAWVRRNTIGTDDYILAHGDQIANRGLHFGFRANNQFTFAFWGNDLNVGTFTDTNVWHLWTGVFDLPTSTQVLYRDGIEVGRRTAPLPLLSDTGTVFRIGERINNARHNGGIDEVRVACLDRSSNWVWATWYNTVSNEAFICYDPAPLPTGAVDLAVTKTASTNTLAIGTNLTYTIGVMNLSTNDAGGVVVTDTLPAEVTFLWAMPAAVQTNGSQYTFALGTINGGAGTTIMVHVAVTSAVPGPITNWAFGMATNSELNLANNRDNAVTTLPDSDGDGMANPGDPDDDNDRFGDVAEGIAGTDPLDANDFLWLRISRTLNQTIQDLTFPTATGRTYRIQSATNLYIGPWLDVQTGIPGDGNPMVIPDTNLIDRLYFRIGVEFP